MTLLPLRLIVGLALLLLREAPPVRIPRRHPGTMHLKQYALNNSLRGLRRWARTHRGGWTDKDFHAFQWARDGVDPYTGVPHKAGDWVLICIHWLQPTWNPFTLIRTRLGVPRPLRRNERESIAGWPAEKVLRLRSTTGLRPVTGFAMAREHKRLGVKMLVEAKWGTAGTNLVQPYRDLANYSRKIRAEVAVMTLPMGPWARRLAAAWRAGFDTTLIGGRHPAKQPERWRNVPRPRWLTATWIRGWTWADPDPVVA